MATGIDFNADSARMLERTYQTPDVLAQRARFHHLLALRPGERVLDVGVGPGLLAREMGETVGSSGAVMGIDQSEAMLEMTGRRCADLEHASFTLADACELPYPDAHFDAVVSTQVYEYVADMETALAEAARVLKPAGRIQILDTDWDSAVWSTRHPARMRKVMDAWDEHLHDPHLPTSLVPLLEGAGFRVYLREVIPLLNPSFQKNCYSYGISAAIRNFVIGRGGVDEPEAQAWREEFRKLESEGAYFFSLNRYVFAGTKL
jgi:ubiquinone/menaquinone biosynthesis C-methylase UbiE